jgi:hypothetical protein
MDLISATELKVNGEFSRGRFNRKNDSRTTRVTRLSSNMVTNSYIIMSSRPQHLKHIRGHTVNRIDYNPGGYDKPGISDSQSSVLQESRSMDARSQRH